MSEVELPNAEELEEIRGKKFTRRVALTTAIYAVVLAITSLGGNNAMKEMLLAAQQSSDQWAFYQAKVIREHLYRSQKMRLEIDLIERSDRMKPEVKEKLEALLKKLSDEEARYSAEKKEIEKEAKKLEHERDVNRSKDPYFDYAEVLLQIAIVMASVSILSASRPVFFFSMISAFLGAIFCLNGFFMIFHLPFFPLRVRMEASAGEGLGMRLRMVRSRWRLEGGSLRSSVFVFPCSFSRSFSILILSRSARRICRPSSKRFSHPLSPSSFQQGGEGLGAGKRIFRKPRRGISSRAGMFLRGQAVRM